MAALKLERVHILGHSWGSMPALDYALTRPAELASLVLASPCVSATRWMADLRALVAALPSGMRDVIADRERAGEFPTDAYWAAIHEFNKRHCCRIDPRPVALQRASAKANDAIYELMWGTSEWNMTGSLRYYERTERLGELAVPVVWVCGRDDEARPETLAVYQSLVAGSELAVIEDAGHFAHLEQPERYLAAVRGFLRRVDAAGEA